MIEKKIINYFKRISQKFLQSEEQSINLCLPIAFGLGIIFYFAIPFEPKLWPFLCLFILSGFGFFFLRSKNNFALLFLFALFFFGGVCRIVIQTNYTQAPFIHKRYQFVATQGTVEKVERHHSGLRLTLTDLKLDKIPHLEQPLKIRVSVNGQNIIPNVGDVISLKTTLSPPMLPMYPGGYNFARTAYYEQIGAVGFAVSKLNIVSTASENSLQRVRMSVYKRITDILSKDTGDIAAALVTGEQGGISKETRDNYTSAGIVHILSVSGFHMSLIAGFIFAILRLLFSLFPSVSLRFNTKKICALLALILTFAYLLISGMGIPAIRSFIMIAFVLIAVIADRQALSMRSVLWAGFLILMFQPQAIINAGFALSFGAVMALIAGYESFTPVFKKFCVNHPNIWIKWILGTICFFLLMNIIAHFATAPIAIHHFHRYNNYGILGNFVISLLFSFLIMPLLFISILFMPFGLDKPFLFCVDYLLKTVGVLTKKIADLPYSTIYLPSFPTWGYALILSGGAFLLIFKSRVRYLGIAPIFIGLLSIFTYTAPDVIIGQGGQLIAIRQDNTFMFNTLTKQKATRYAWMENNGINPNISPPKIKKDTELKVQNLTIDLTGTGDADIIINSPNKCDGKLLCLSRKKLWKEGVHTLYIKNGKIKVKTAADGTFNRPWSQGQFQKAN